MFTHIEVAANPSGIFNTRVLTLTSPDVRFTSTSNLLHQTENDFVHKSYKLVVTNKFNNQNNKERVTDT